MSRIPSFGRWLILSSVLFVGSVVNGQQLQPTPLDAAELEQCPPEAGMDGGIIDGDYGFAGGYSYTVPCRELDYNRPDLFYNFYVPNQCGSLPAQMYLAPRPVPPLVGHTYYTYQPFLPHEFLYEHKRTYYRYYNDGRGLNRTKVEWKVAPVTHVQNAWHWLRIPR